MSKASHKCAWRQVIHAAHHWKEPSVHPMVVTLLVSKLRGWLNDDAPKNISASGMGLSTSRPLVVHTTPNDEHHSKHKGQQGGYDKPLPLRGGNGYITNEHLLTVSDPPCLTSSHTSCHTSLLP